MNMFESLRARITGAFGHINSVISLWMVRVLMAGYAVFAVDRVIHIVQGDRIVTMSVTLVAALASVWVHFRVQGMINAGQNNRAAVWLMATNFVLLAIIQAADPGNSPVTGITIGLVLAVIAVQMLSHRWKAVGIFLAFSSGAVIAVFDYVLPGTGGGIDFHSVSLYVLLAVDAIFLYFLFRPYTTYQMNVKFLLAMTILTLSAIICTFLPAYLVLLSVNMVNGEELLFSVQRAAVVAGALFVLISGGVSFLIARSISRPLVRMISSIQAIGETGDFSQSFDVQQQGEFSLLAKALNDMNSYFMQLSEVAEKISGGDLALQVSPRSKKDVLGYSFLQMGDSMRQLVRLISDSAQHLSAASGNLETVVGNSSQMVDTILQAVQHVLVSEEGGEGDSASFKQLARAIESIAGGAQDQARSVSQAAGFSTQIGSFVEQVTENMQTVRGQSLDAARNARDGVQIMDEMVEQIENIRLRVSQSATSVSEMGERSRQIEEIVTTIETIASQTNLLALNTAIEAARSAAHTGFLAEKILDSTMEAQAWLVANLLLNWSDDMASQRYWVDLSRQCHVDNINVTDDEGVIVYTNEASIQGFRFSNDPKAQTYAFFQLIGQKGAVACQPLQKRDADDKHYKYVGVSRLDRPGIVQVGFDGSSIERYKSGGGVFSVISEEILKLANQTQLATKEIMELNLNIQTTINEAVTSMIEGENEVNSGVTKAGLARESLNTILSGTEATQNQIELAAGSVSNVEQATRELAEAMDSVSAVVEENTAATEEMAASTTEVSESVQMIAQLVQDMTGDMNEIGSAVRSLANIADSAREVAAKYRLE